MHLFHTASDEEIKQGKTTDVYFTRAKEILKAKKKDKVKVVAEVTVGNLPESWSWGILCGIEEVAKLFEGYPVNVYSFPEGSLFYPKDRYGVREPVMVIEGVYVDFCVLETPLLGLICQASGIATKAARIRKMAGDKLLISFGIRRIHPTISPMVDRAAYIGGFDGVSCLTGAKLIGKKPTGTMPHALIIIFGNQVEAWKAFDEIIEPEVPRIALIDTYFDEKIEAVKAAEALDGRLYGVRLDTPNSRRGNFAEIVREVKWELAVRGYENVKVMVSGGIDELNIKPLIDAGVDGFGVGTSISAAPIIDFAMDIVEIEGKPVAKRGKLGGKKEVWRCPSCMKDIVLPFRKPQPKCPDCGNKMEPMLKPLIREGKIVEKQLPPGKIREHVLNQLGKIKQL
ncbi:nicotinate phosphoribosyltransferase [Candidatus Bathyarchaeota archaeon]|nr:MAG: nicotinate phosphoribosyltransferase [Candidatus Bathyarchaeota archaeon]